MSERSEPILRGTEAKPGDPAAESPEGVIRSISGFKPLMTGRWCDSCSAPLTEGETVYVALDYLDERWTATRTQCEECRIEPREWGPTNAVARCELGHHDEGADFAPLLNPDVMGFVADTK